MFQFNGQAPVFCWVGNCCVRRWHGNLAHHENIYDTITKDP
jgi:hypothetical protein